MSWKSNAVPRKIASAGLVRARAEDIGVANPCPRDCDELVFDCIPGGPVLTLSTGVTALTLRQPSAVALRALGFWPIHPESKSAVRSASPH